MLFWHYFTKAKILFWQKQLLYAQSQKYYFGKNNYIMLKAQNYFLAKYILKSLTHGKYKFSQECFSQQNL